MKSTVWKQMEPKRPLPDWLVVLLTPILFGLFLGVLFVVVPIGLAMSWVLG